MKGIDISNLNGSVDIAKVKAAGCGFVISKITEGHTFIDKYGSKNIANTKANGLIAGAYHFARFTNKISAVQEASFFKEHCPSNVDFVVLDFEQNCGGDMTEACLAFLDSVASLAPAFIYCNPNYIKLHLNSSVTKYPLWIANYGEASPAVPLWGKYAIWQYSEGGSINGIDEAFDLDVTGEDFNINNGCGKSNTTVLLQSQLNSLINSGLVVDGIYGQATTAAVKKFQTLMELQIDGTAGNNTWSAINQIRLYPTDGVNYPHYEYATRWIQWRVVASVDGIFGNGTEEKVKEFQKSVNSAYGENLAVDGIVGKETWRCMFKY